LGFPVRTGRSAFRQVGPLSFDWPDFGKLRLAYQARPGLLLSIFLPLFVNLRGGEFAMSWARRLVEFIADERATTAIEYCVIGGMLSILILVGAQLIGVNIAGRFLGPLVAGFP
jgi:Flp pilus assembly pilin Flp